MTFHKSGDIGNLGDLGDMEAENLWHFFGGWGGGGWVYSDISYVLRSYALLIST